MKIDHSFVNINYYEDEINNFRPSLHYPVKLDADFMTDEELHKMSGEVKVYKIGE